VALRSFNSANSEEARQFLLDRKCERNHPKRHRTSNRAKRLSKAKKQRIAHATAVRLSAYWKHKAAVRLYWVGERNAHP